jgi:hypothetical protein
MVRGGEISASRTPIANHSAFPGWAPGLWQRYSTRGAFVGYRRSESEFGLTGGRGASSREEPLTCCSKLFDPLDTKSALVTVP